MMRSYSNKILLGVSFAALMAPVSALAQTAPVAAPTPAADEQTPGSTEKDIVVIGTLIRGTTAVGSQTVSVDSSTIAAKSASSTNEMLSLIPQIANTFNGRFEGDPRGVSAGISITKPNLRNLPSANTSSSATTLVLVNGMRLTPVGVNQAAVDADIVPTAVLEGVDAVTDGGSSLYGADAVAGVLNFRTMRKFDGVKVDGNFGFGTTIKGYHQWDAAITAGHSWSSGNAYISVGHSDRDGISNGEAPWSSALVYNAAGVGSYNYTQCNSPVGTQIKYFFFGTGWTNNAAAPGAGTFPIGTACDQLSSQSYVPQQKRTNVFASVTQEIAENIDLRVTGYWTKRDTVLTDYPRGYTTPAQTPVFPTSPAPTIGQIYTILGGTGFSFGPNAAYVNTPTRLGFETWGITPELTLKLGGNWQLRTSAHFGRSTNYQRTPGVNTILAQCYIAGCTGIAAGQLNPLNVAAASAAVVTDITNYENAQDTVQQLFVLRSIADGPLFALPGGDAKLAVGVEYQDNLADSRLTAGRVGTLAAQPYMKAARNSKSVFGEISLPLASFVDVSASVRYDSYSDFGATTNPNIGVTFKPVSGLKIFGHWNTSFNAPTALDDLAIATGRFVCGIYTDYSANPAIADPTKRPADPALPPRDTSKQGTCAFVMQGSSPGLEPQTAKSWALGFEATPVSGLRFGGEFYSIDFKNVLGSLNPSNSSTYLTNPNLYTYNVTAAGWANTLAQLTNGAALAAQHPNTDIALIVDTRTTNLNAAKIEGVDFHINYDTDTRFGHLAFGVSGTEMTRARLTSSGVTTNELGHSGTGGPRFTAISFVGWNNEHMSARMTVSYTGKYHDAATNYLGVVEDISPFVVANLNLGYDFKESGGPLSGTSLRLTVDNLFEETPETIKRLNTNNPSYNNWTLGRVIKIGATKKF
jgi:iron complex outermembrane receptor protein